MTINNNKLQLSELIENNPIKFLRAGNLIFTRILMKPYFYNVE